MPHTILQAKRLVKRAVRPLPRARSGFIVFSLAAVLAGCASGPPAAVSNIRYDLGDPAPLGNTMPMPPVKVLAVSASKNLDTDAFLYRLKYADAQRIGRYSDSHWTMSPADLLTQRLRVALASRGPVLTGSDPVRAPMLQVDLTDFEQVFDAPEKSHGEVSARVTLSQHGQVVSQRTFIARAPSYTPDAAGGARALAAASDDLIAQMAAWLGVQPLVASQ
ncbi:MAG: ABC-type transport auxiliary lipoprotein family protein [Pseudomonadota bacterium]|jgi:cholesterol transport system auxiliary component|uniref:Putative lipoprotein n=1 Tax=Caballeronia sordidicola TaxID=196367 RepID=A0A242M5D2_CABSO|nr:MULTISPECIES: ABC-type transport auxiliary lipoprotein family protein [Burkholderiaceae]MDP9156478.1 ABC-type transport auxiliary lipoprotein family protein [Pseudomonadota bacterium]AME23618.1 ABC transporter [Burkholderia sp. PAMC 26561]AMM12799.1 ABC transporter [Burkholderia sp. PAMC 28687]OTP65820.1 putative lipoprotein [Caballeronia sordidicola]OTP75769.1 putative lipoprotein [Caballeronia sordidicola]